MTQTKFWDWDKIMALDIGEVSPCINVFMSSHHPRCLLREASSFSGVAPVMVLTWGGSVFKTGDSGGGIVFVILPFLQWKSTGVKISAGSGQITRIQGRVSLTPGRSLLGSILSVVLDLLLNLASFIFQGQKSIA